MIKQSKAQSWFSDGTRKLLLIAFVVLVPIALVVLSSRENGSSTDDQSTSNVLVAADMSDFSDIKDEDKLAYQDLYDWDLIVLGSGDGESVDEGLQDVAEDLAQKVAILPEGDYNSDVQYPLIETVGDSDHIILDVRSGVGGACSFDESQMQRLKKVLESSSRRKVLYSSRPVLPDELLPEFENVSQLTDCQKDSWSKINSEIGPEDQVQAVISTDSAKTVFRGVRQEDRAYVVAGNADGGRMMLTRIHDTGEEYQINEQAFKPQEFIDAQDLLGIDSIELNMKDLDLLEVYDNSPYVDFSIMQTGVVKDWQKTILSDEVLDEIQSEYDCESDGSEECSISIRGNVADHWYGIKKSWDVEVDGHKHKLIRPQDRSYSMQKILAEMVDQVGGITPSIGIKRLVVNGYDFGIYLDYEDLSKELIELSGYNSDVDASRGVFFDDFSGNDIYASLNNVSHEKTKGDNSYQQIWEQLEVEDIDIANYFDQQQMANWVVTQMVANDTHQNNQDNMRFFTDKATGKYVMVTWDLGLSTLEKGNSIFDRNTSDRAIALQQTFYDSAFGKVKIKERLRVIVEGKESLMDEVFGSIENDRPLFLSDALAEENDDVVNAKLDSAGKALDANIDLSEEIWLK